MSFVIRPRDSSRSWERPSDSRALDLGLRDADFWTIDLRLGVYHSWTALADDEHGLVACATAQRTCREAVGARGPTEAEVDASGVQRLQHAELLGDREGGVVGQHDAARAQPDATGGLCEMGDEHRG